MKNLEKMLDQMCIEEKLLRNKFHFAKKNIFFLDWNHQVPSIHIYLS